MNQKISITTAIPYVNGSPHIGHIADVLFADLLARYHRQKGDRVFYLTGTDEHGQKNWKTAKEQGREVEEFVDEKSTEFENLDKKLNISYDRFIRTEDSDHLRVSQNLWRKLEEAGDVYPGEYEGLYCVGCEAYLNSDDLNEEGLCPIHLKAPEKIKEKNYFFRLSKYSQEITKAIKSDQFKIIPENRKNEILAFIGQELKDTSFSRPKNKLPWGIPVPNDSDQVMYVWCDALTNYLTGISNWRNGDNRDNGKNRGYTGEKGSEGEYWPPTYQVIGKDILRFHAAIWPAMLLSAGLALPKFLIVHGFFNVEGLKISKSLGNNIDPIVYIEKYGADAVRYYVFRELPLEQDGNFSDERFINLYNSDLANNLGNLVNRVMTLALKNGATNFSFDYLLNLASREQEDQVKELNQFNEQRAEFNQLIENFRFNETLLWVWQKIDDLNRQIDREKPWAAAKLPGKDLIKIMVGIYLFKIELIACWLEPFLPETSKKIQEQIRTQKIKVLFPRIETP